MTIPDIEHVWQQWNAACFRRKEVRRAIDAMTVVKQSLDAECERLTELIAEHDNTPIVTTDKPQEGGKR